MVVMTYPPTLIFILEVGNMNGLVLKIFEKVNRDYSGFKSGVKKCELEINRLEIKPHIEIIFWLTCTL